MATKSILILGGSGFLGSSLALQLREGYKVFATYYNHRIQIPGVTSLHLDVGNKNWIKRIVYMAKPDVVIYALGNPSMEWAERNVRIAEHVHTSGAGAVSNVSEIFQPKFIYLSSCYVFDGTRGNYKENDTPLPSTILGKAKVGGENFIRGRCLNHIIIRSTAVFGRGNGKALSFLDYLRMDLDRGKRVELNNHYLHAPAPIEGLLEMITRLVDSGIRNKTFHYGGLTKMTKLGFAKRFANYFGYDPELIVGTRTAQEQAALPYFEPLDYSLNFTQAVETLKIKPLLLEESFDLIKQKLIPHA